jgi:hypothetical protein
MHKACQKAKKIINIFMAKYLIIKYRHGNDLNISLVSVLSLLSRGMMLKRAKIPAFGAPEV